MFNSNVITIGDKKNGRIAINKKHAGEFADLVIRYRNSQASAEELVGFIWNNVTTDYEDEVYDKMYNQLKADWIEVKNCCSMIGLGGVVAGLTRGIYIVTTALSGDYEWDKKFYSLLQMVTEVSYQLAQYCAQTQSTGVAELDEALTNVNNILKSPIYSWYTLSDNSVTPMQLDARAYCIIADCSASWRWIRNEGAYDDGSDWRHYYIDNLAELVQEKATEIIKTGAEGLSNFAQNAATLAGKGYRQIKVKVTEPNANAVRLLAERQYLMQISMEHGIPLVSYLHDVSVHTTKKSLATYYDMEYEWLCSIGEELTYDEIKDLYDIVVMRLCSIFRHLRVQRRQLNDAIDIDANTKEVVVDVTPKDKYAKDMAVMSDMANELDVSLPEQVVFPKILDTPQGVEIFLQMASSFISMVYSNVDKRELAALSSDLIDRAFSGTGFVCGSDSIDIPLEDVDVIVIDPKDIEVVNNCDIEKESKIRQGFTNMPVYEEYESPMQEDTTPSITCTSLRALADKTDLPSSNLLPDNMNDTQSIRVHLPDSDGMVASYGIVESGVANTSNIVTCNKTESPVKYAMSYLKEYLINYLNACIANVPLTAIGFQMELDNLIKVIPSLPDDSVTDKVISTLNNAGKLKLTLPEPECPGAVYDSNTNSILGASYKSIQSFVNSINSRINGVSNHQVEGTYVIEDLAKQGTEGFVDNARNSLKQRQRRGSSGNSLFNDIMG